MTTPTSAFGKFLLACKTQGVVPTPFVLIVSVASQSVSLFENSYLRSGGRQTAAFSGSLPRAATGEFQFAKKIRCSTSRFGISQVAGSNGTPLGLHRVVEKIGGGWLAGTVFKGRRPVGFTWQGMPDAKITTRILWLEGLEPGFNRSDNVDSYARYIYVHGTGDQTTIGKPTSCGCIHLADDDLIPLFDKLPGGTLVWIGEK
ncbi:MAG: L,D-transpeptidase [Limisphaerales bacterium]